MKNGLELPGPGMEKNLESYVLFNWLLVYMYLTMEHLEHMYTLFYVTNYFQMLTSINNSNSVEWHSYTSDSFAIPIGGERVMWVCINLCLWPYQIPERNPRFIFWTCRIALQTHYFVVGLNHSVKGVLQCCSAAVRARHYEWTACNANGQRAHALQHCNTPFTEWFSPTTK